HITMLSAIFSLMMQGRPPIGAHFFIFYFTGLIPYLLFVHTSSAMSHAVTSNGALLQLPLVTTFDVIAARGLLEIITDVDPRGHPAGRFWLHRPRGRAGRSVDAFNGASRHGDVRLRHRLYQCGAHGPLPVL